MHIREMRVSYGKGVSVEGQKGPVSVKNGHDVAAMMTPLLESEVAEVGYVLCLTTRMGVIGYHQMSRGSLDATSMHPREVFRAAVLGNAASIVLVHNHPSGEPTPSVDDVAVTTRIKDAGQLMGIELLDHIIIGHEGRYYSFKEGGQL